MKTLLTLALLAALAAGAAGLSACGRGADSDARLIETPAPEEVRLVCAECRKTFAQSEGRPVPSRQDTLVCPHCGEPTSVRLRARE